MKKILIRIGIFLSIIVIGLVLLNAPYFIKQVKFMLGIIKTEQSVPNQSGNENLETGEPNVVQISSLGISAPIQYVTEKDEAVFQEALQNGAVHYPGTADVGQLGNAYIFGHSSDFILAKGDYKTVFALLPSIKNGAEIVVSGQDGRVYRYEVIDQRVVNNDDVEVLSQKDYKEKLLTLQTSYPVGTALQRYVVIAKLKE